MSKEDLKLALDALKKMCDDAHKWQDVGENAIDILEAALAKQEQGKPVAYLHQCRKKPELKALSFKKHEPELFAKGYKAIPLSDTTPQQRKPPLLSDDSCAKILKLAEENAGLSHKAWDIVDPLELISFIVSAAHDIKGSDHV